MTTTLPSALKAWQGLRARTGLGCCQNPWVLPPPEGAAVAAVSRGGRKSQERRVTRELQVPRAGLGWRGGVGHG